MRFCRVSVFFAIFALMKRLFMLLLMLAAVPAFGQLQFGSVTVDVGTVSEDDAPREWVFPYVNVGDKPVVITRVETTCGCASPRYAKAPVLAGAKGEVGIKFYPKSHPGALSKSVYVHTSASPKPIKLTIVGTVTPTTDRYAEYPFRIGAFRLKQTEVRLGVVRRPGRTMARVQVVNEGRTPLTLGVSNAPAWLEFRSEPQIIAPDSVGDLVFIGSSAGLEPGKIEAAVILDGVAGTPAERTIGISAEIR